MYLTEQEIMEQHIALQKTYDYMIGEKESIKEFFNKWNRKKFVIFGSGSSYMLAKSAQRLFMACKNTSATAISGGDYLVNPDFYKETIEDSIVITLSRSGQTSEILRDIKHIKETAGCPILSLTMKQDNDFMPYTDLDLTMDWCYDKSVCQTRTVTNLYAAILLLTAIYSEDVNLLESVEMAVKLNQDFKDEYRPVLKEIAKKEWDNAIVLADGALCGIAEEGALAFTEISMLSGKQFNVLDYRHGPVVINDKNTLTIMTIQPCGRELQQDMAEDLKKKNGVLVTVSEEEGNPYQGAEHVCVGQIKRHEAWGIPMIFICQILAYEKAMLLGTNPDEPTGLDAFITLK